MRAPGIAYAQVITPGYVVRLANEGREFECRVAGERLVRVPDLPAGRVPDEVWAIQVFAYHPAVDLLLHGYLACSADAVLPLARWVPLDASPLVAALTLLLGEGLAPWEGEVGYGDPAGTDREDRPPVPRRGGGPHPPAGGPPAVG